MKHLEKLHEVVGNLTIAMPEPLALAPVERKLIILVDIVGFSKSDTRTQVMDIYLFQRYVWHHVLTNRLGFDGKVNIQHFVPTGDGCYIIADECSPDVAVDFVANLVAGLQYVEPPEGAPMSLRAGALIGDCVRIMDMSRHFNYIGEGMNEASRILSGGQAIVEKQFMELHPEASHEEMRSYSRNSIFLGDSLASVASEWQEDCEEIAFFKDVADKHGKTRNVTVLRQLK